MSDFGTTISVTNPNRPIDAGEAASLSTSLKEYITTNEMDNAIGEPYLSDFELNEDGTLYLQLSEHYFGGEDEEEDADLLVFITELELEDAKLMVAELQTQFPDYSYTPAVDEW